MAKLIMSRKIVRQKSTSNVRINLLLIVNEINKKRSKISNRQTYKSILKG